jgi:hypothetical protein
MGVSFAGSANEFSTNCSSVCLCYCFGFGRVRQATRWGIMYWGDGQIDGDGSGLVGGRRAEGYGDVGGPLTRGRWDEIVWL